MKTKHAILMIALTLLLAVGIVSAAPGLPTVDFAGTPVTGEAPLTVNFNKITTNTSPAIYSWTFGDGWSLTGASVSHVYQNPGKYDVTLEMSGLGWGYTMSKTDYITVTHVKPVASFAYHLAKDPAAVPVNCTFNSATTTGEEIEYLWDFGDGSSSTLANPRHLYTVEGAYPVSLTVTNDGGADTEVQVVTVLPEAPRAAIGADSATTGAVPLAVQFRDDSTGVGINKWNWTFGDGTFSTQQNPLHAYGAVGLYNVRLLVKSPSGSGVTEREEFINVTATSDPIVCPTPEPTPEPTVCPTPTTCPEVDTSKVTATGVFRGDGLWFVRSTNTDGTPDANFIYGTVGDTPLLGDWNGDGVATPGVFRGGMFFLRNTNTGGFPDISFAYGAAAGDTPVVGDWNGDGVDTVGIIRNGAFYLRNTNTNGLPDMIFGQSGDIPAIEH